MPGHLPDGGVDERRRATPTTPVGACVGALSPLPEGATFTWLVNADMELVTSPGPSATIKGTASSRAPGCEASFNHMGRNVGAHDEALVITT